MMAFPANFSRPRPASVSLEFYLPLKIHETYCSTVVVIAQLHCFTMEGARELQEEAKCYLLNLPTELLVLIFALLSSRDKVKVWHVAMCSKFSQLIHAISTPLLWRVFMWPYYDDREELIIKEVLTTQCGEYIQKMTFPHHVIPFKLVKMLQYCSNVTHLSLPENTVFNETEVRESVGHMKHLRYLDVCWVRPCITPLLLIGANFEELTVYFIGKTSNTLLGWLREWINNNCNPQNLSIVWPDKEFSYSSVQEELMYAKNNFGCSVNPATVRIYTSLKMPLNIIPPVPIFQLDYSPTAPTPCTSASYYGLGKDVLLITNSHHGDSMVHMATVVLNTFFDTASSFCKFTNIEFVTTFSAKCSGEFLSGHLAQLAMACPNLQQLNLWGNSQCLESLQGLHSIAHYCKKLQGLNLSCISVSNVENQVHLWEILSDMKLTHLAIDLCLLKHDDSVKDRFKCLFSRCCFLQAIELFNFDPPCSYCENFETEDLLQLAYFSKLSHCKIDMCHFQCSVVHDALAGCNALSTLHIRCSSMYFLPLSITSCILSRYCALKRLCLLSDCAVISEDFMKTVSAHNGLEQVVLLAHEITFRGIIALVKNSSMLVTFRAAVCVAVEQDGIPDLKMLKATLMNSFPHRKIFTIGSYKVSIDKSFSYLWYLNCSEIPNKDILLDSTDFMLSLWHKSI